MTLRTISYGGGVQSTALVVLATQGKIGHVDAALFANVGDDSEHPGTLRYVREVAIPWAAERGLPVHEIRRTYADGREHPTLYQYMIGGRSVPIPVRLSGGAPASRTCTAKWKGDTLRRWREQAGATAENKAVSLVGISTDEHHRINKKKAGPAEEIEYPLIDLGLSRNDCANIIRDAGLPVPGKSSCWFCPWQSVESWRRRKAEEPDLFAKGVALEALLSERTSGPTWSEPGPCFMTATLRPLSEITQGIQPALFTDGTFNDGACDEGYCWT